MTAPNERSAPDRARFEDAQTIADGLHVHDTAIVYSRGYGNNDNTPDQRNAPDFAEFRNAVLADQSDEKGQAWIAAAFRIAPDDEAHQRDKSRKQVIGKHHRCRACSLPRAFLGFDIDGGLTPESWSALVMHLQRHEAFAYTTASHTQDHPRARVIVALDMPLPRADLIRATVAMRGRIDAALQAEGHTAPQWDASCDRSEQPLYGPLHDAETYVMDGAPACAAELLADLPLERHTTPPEPPRALTVTTERHADMRTVAAHLARLVASDSLAPESALQVLQSEADRGRWSRVMPPDELQRALHGAITKYRTGEWSLPVPANDADTGAQPLTLTPLGDLAAATLPPVRCVLEPYLPVRQVTLLGSHGGMGKTYLALAVAACVAADKPWAEHTVTPCRVLFVSLEDEPDLIRWRLAKVCEQYELDGGAVEENMALLDGTSTVATLFTEVGNGKALAESVAWKSLVEYATGFGLVIIDNASDAFNANANDPALVRLFLRKLQTVARQHDSAILLLAHVDKNAAKHGAQGNSYLGTTAWHNTVRSRLALVREDNGPIKLVHEKHNLTPNGGTVYLQQGLYGVPMPANVVDMRKGSEYAAKLQSKEDAPEVRELIRKAHDGGQTVYTARTGPCTAYSAVKNFGRPPMFDGADGKRRFWAAVDLLAANRRITQETFTTTNRKQKTRWVPVAGGEALAQNDD